MPYESPWQQAGGSFGDIGQSLNNAILRMAQAKYAAEARAQEMQMKREELASQNEMYRHRSGLFDAQALEETAKAAKEKQVLESAKAFGEAGRTAQTSLPEEWGQTSLGESLVPYGAISDRQSADAGVDQEAALNTVMALLAHPERAAQWKTEQMMNNALKVTPEMAQARFLGNKNITVPREGGGVFDPVIGKIVGETSKSVKAPSGSKVETDQGRLNALSAIIRAVSSGGLPPMQSDPGYQSYTNAIAQSSPIISRIGGVTNAAPTVTGSTTPRYAPKTQQEYDAIPSGEIYTDTDGKVKRKK